MSVFLGRKYFGSFKYFDRFCRKSMNFVLNICTQNNSRLFRIFKMKTLLFLSYICTLVLFMHFISMK